ncbi:hypothetical protein QFC21_007168 [Naganishia friedmannii]|uniref:Uncharacterized protein n=2 Tax=Naganishia friedmannii TaxID=89922 RepID=A0ACC2UUR4_9TREE|nr:hypothetical protein QFC21_007372 [Naganishia friedmannii]KAJ9091543.1 hypothetical protein QFC21_007168 [Naganishia friedmannii]
MAVFTVAFLTALAASASVKALPTLDVRHNDQKDHKDWNKGKDTKNYTEFEGWNTFKGYGSNLGTWLEIEVTNTPNIFLDAGYNVTDEWTFCREAGFEYCGQVLENHYATYYTTADIDKIATVGVNVIRIPTTYAAWIEVPGSFLYRGNQLKYLRNVTDYAIKTYGIHVILDLHSLPGGVNGLEIGEAFGNQDWFFNQTNFDYSLQAVDAVIEFVKSSVAPEQFTIAPINEPSDNLAGFGSPDIVTEPAGVDWVLKYLRAAYAKIQARCPSIWLMQNDSFKGSRFWAPYWNTTDKIVFDQHLYFFAGDGVYGNLIPGITCGQAAAIKPPGFNVFIGEFSLQSQYNNSLLVSRRQEVYDSQVVSFQKFLSGGAFWNTKFQGMMRVNGEGTQNDYWNFELLIDEGVVRPLSQVNMSYCLDTPVPTS